MTRHAREPDPRSSLAERVGQAADIAPSSVSINHLHKFFGDFAAVRGASLEVAAGSIVALLGPSGCGKTTLLRCIAGLERPSSGEIRVGSTTVSGAGVATAPERRSVGMVFQDCALFPHASVARNVGFGLPRRERRSSFVDELLSLVGLEGLGDRSPETLSGGQQQRVALARTLAHSPSVILLDEPFSNLDALLRAQLRRETRDVMSALGMTAIFVTHDQGEAFELGDEVAVMIDGIVQQQGSPATLYERPRTRAVAEFIGDTNVLDGHATGTSAESAIGSIPLVEPAEGAVELILRPERLELLAGDDGVIEQVDYYGHDTTYHIRLDAGLELLVRVLATPELQIGDRVSVGYTGAPAPSFAANGAQPPGAIGNHSPGDGADPPILEPSLERA